MNKHVHAELIKKWADGAEIEYYDAGFCQWFKTKVPAWNAKCQYRVAKPLWQDDLLKAVLNGDVVEFYVPRKGWIKSEINYMRERYEFHLSEQNRYRIKPREVVRYMTLNSGRVVHISSNQEHHSNIKLTLDYKYGNPIAVELIGSAKKDY
jgi:hypothetical protein